MKEIDTDKVVSELESMDYKNLNVNTRQRLWQFAETFDVEPWKGRPMSELFNSLLDNVSIAHNEELDAAAQAAMQTLANRLTDAMVETSANRLTEAQTDDVFRHCYQELFTGYWVARSILGTGRDVLRYSNPGTESENADKLLQMLSDPAFNDCLSDTGGLEKVFESYRIGVAGQGPFSLLTEEKSDAIAATSARGGMLLAVLEHDVFVEGGGSSVIRPDDLDYVAKLAVAAFKVNEEMGLDNLHAGCAVLALQEIDAMKASTLIYNSGDSDGFRMIVAAMPKSLDRQERKLLGFTPLNSYPAKAVDYLKILVTAATELGFTDYSDDFIQMIQSKPAGE